MDIRLPELPRFQDRLKFVRKTILDQTQVEFAETMGVGQSTAAGWESNSRHGAKSLEDRHIVRIAELSGVPEPWLRYGKDYLEVSAIERRIIEMLRRAEPRAASRLLTYLEVEIAGMKMDPDEVIAALNEADRQIRSGEDPDAPPDPSGTVLSVDNAGPGRKVKNRSEHKP